MRAMKALQETNNVQQLAIARLHATVMRAVLLGSNSWPAVCAGSASGAASTPHVQSRQTHTLCTVAQRY
jgi:hypothetical protein